MTRSFSFALKIVSGMILLPALGGADSAASEKII
jgi:hypothetical protein